MHMLLEVLSMQANDGFEKKPKTVVLRLQVAGLSHEVLLQLKLS